jgi:hypothetical protein
VNESLSRVFHYEQNIATLDAPPQNTVLINLFPPNTFVVACGGNPHPVVASDTLLCGSDVPIPPTWVESVPHFLPGSDCSATNVVD